MLLRSFFHADNTCFVLLTVSGSVRQQIIDPWDDNDNDSIVSDQDQIIDQPLHENNDLNSQNSQSQQNVEVEQINNQNDNIENNNDNAIDHENESKEESIERFLLNFQLFQVDRNTTDADFVECVSIFAFDIYEMEEKQIQTDDLTVVQNSKNAIKIIKKFKQNDIVKQNCNSIFELPSDNALRPYGARNYNQNAVNAFIQSRSQSINNLVSANLRAHANLLIMYCYLNVIGNKTMSNYSPSRRGRTNLKTMLMTTYNLADRTAKDVLALIRIFVNWPYFSGYDDSRTSLRAAKLKDNGYCFSIFDLRDYAESTELNEDLAHFNHIYTVDLDNEQ